MYIFGDFNSRVGKTNNYIRVGEKNDYIVHGRVDMCIGDIDYSPDRTQSRAYLYQRKNNHGIKFLEFCKATGLGVDDDRQETQISILNLLSQNGCSAHCRLLFLTTLLISF